MAAGSAAAEEARGYAEIMAEAEAAFGGEDWATLASRLDEAQAIRPYSLYLTRNRILAKSLSGDAAAAIAIAAKVADRGLSMSLSGHAGFETLAGYPEMAAIRTKMTANIEPVGAETTHALHDDDGLLPETVAIEPRSQDEFVGSVRTGKILRFRKGAAEGFAIAPGGVYALEFHDGDLWAAVNSGPPFEGAAGPSEGALHRYRLKDGTALDRYPASGEAILGALEATPLGLVASDSATPRLVILRRGAGALETLSEDARYVNLQGVAFDARRSRLYVADYLVGIFSVDLETGAARLLENAADAHLGGVDGLYVHNGDLIGIQNGTTPQRIVRLRLDQAGGAIDRVEILQQSLGGWAEPTNGVVAGDELLYVATSNWPAYGADGALKNDVARRPLTIMSAPLQ